MRESTRIQGQPGSGEDGRCTAADNSRAGPSASPPSWAEEVGLCPLPGDHWEPQRSTEGMPWALCGCALIKNNMVVTPALTAKAPYVQTPRS